MRLARINNYPVIGEPKPTHVVWAEVSSYRHVELDADNEEHAYRLAYSWLANGMAMVCSVHEIRPDGGTKTLHIISEAHAVAA